MFKQKRTSDQIFIPFTSPIPGYRCSHYEREVRTSKVSEIGWMIFFGLIFSVYLAPLCFVGLFFRDKYYVCSHCGNSTGVKPTFKFQGLPSVLSR